MRNKAWTAIFQNDDGFFAKNVIGRDSRESTWNSQSLLCPKGTRLIALMAGNHANHIRLLSRRTRKLTEIQLVDPWTLEGLPETDT